MNFRIWKSLGVNRNPKRWSVTYRVVIDWNQGCCVWDKVRRCKENYGVPRTSRDRLTAL